MNKLTVFIFSVLLILIGCSQQATVNDGSASIKLISLMNVYMARAATENPYSAILSGEKPKAMPDFSYGGAENGARFAAQMLQQANAIPVESLSHQEQLSLVMLVRVLKLTQEGLQHYWLNFDVTPYQAGLIISNLPKMLALFDLGKAVDREDYLVFLESIAQVFGDYRLKLEGQRQRGILLPKVAIAGTKGLYKGLRGGLEHMVTPGADRFVGVTSDEQALFLAQVNARLMNILLPKVDSLISAFNEKYIAEAPSTVGISQYPGGLAAYQYMIGRETTLDLSPEQIHQLGLKYMAKLRGQKAAIRNELGFSASEQEFKLLLLSDKQFYAKTPAEVEARYMRYMAMIEPKIDDYFELTPKAAYGVKRLNTASEQSMTFGYYGAPSKQEPKGYYHYNGSKLAERNMIWAQGLVYHELVPGHHFHLALQQENKSLPEFRKNGGFIAAFNEGWANYAASLAGEMGIRNDPYDRYGWLLFDSFITSRLVVDTGMNALGWSLEDARQYMADNTFESEVQIASETIRYSTSIPAQALAYKLGLEQFWEFRRAMEAELGKQFDIKKFHAAAVGSGALPMPLLEKHIQHMMVK
jgi:uncharacterized protein (DUF885 family)